MAALVDKSVFVSQQQQQQLQSRQEFEDNGTLGCICGPCDCGLHLCSTFGRAFEETFSKPPVTSRRPSLDSDNRYTEEVHEELMADAKQQAGAVVLRDREQAGTNQQAACRCINAERYLAKSCAELDQRCSPDDEMLHVLVTRPEIAGKPRDNIVFEGDMDLRTTFETSYEALARLRLEGWKKYQEMKVANGETEQHKCCRHHHPPQQQERTSRSCKRQVDEDNREVDDANHQAVSVANQLREPEELRRESPVAGNAADADRPMTQRPATVVSAPRSRDASPQLRPSSNLESASYIDPDLSSIIVYDSNMNRLERVGLRKRSKYRPSTSLRSGPRGLFGDQPVDELGHSQQQQQARIGAGASRLDEQLAAARAARQVKEAQTQTPTGEELEIEFEEQEQEEQQQQVAVEADYQMAPKSLQSLSARNLNNSKQSEYLVYSGHNLPVDSKRRVLNNVNMVDHIKEQNIIESNLRQPKVTATQHIPEQSEPVVVSYDQSTDQIGTGMESEAHLAAAEATVESELDKLREQCQQEEAEAVEEIQRVTSHGSSDLNGNADLDELRISKLRRKCQNQNFDIHDNYYQTEPVETVKFSHDIPLKSVARPNPVYSNLFSESPDFILTTGKFLDEEAHNGSKSAEPPVESRAPSRSEANRHPFHGEGRTRNNPREPVTRRWK